MNNSPLLLYLHGFGSSPRSEKITLLKEYLAALGLMQRIYAPHLPPDPDSVIPLLTDFIEQQGQSVVVIGSSLGGFYASYFAARYSLKAVLINPAVYPWRLIANYLGHYFDTYSQRTYEIKPEHGTLLQAMAKFHPAGENVLLLLQRGDEVLDYREAITEYPDAHHYIQPNGTHRFENFAKVIPFILEFAGFEKVIK